jgi:hypothetical protein
MALIVLALVVSDGQSFAGSKGIEGGAPVPMQGSMGSLSPQFVGSAPQPLGGGWERFTMPTAPGRAARSVAPSLYDPAEVFVCVSAAGDEPQNLVMLRGVVCGIGGVRVHR